MPMDKKQMEVLIIEYFRECYNEFPKGKVVPSESPDFILKMKSTHLLGIELTRLNPANAVPISENLQQEINFQEQLILKIKAHFERTSQYNLFVKFLFSETIKIAPERELSLVVRMARLISEQVKHKSGKRFFKETIPKSQLPEGIEEIVIMYHPGLETPVWERSNNLGISNDVVDDIRKSIHKKDEKLRLYQKQRLNYYWLLITTDRLRGIKSFNLPNKINNQKFKSRFQHVFLLDLVKGKIFELV
jgi:hypothetical protein